jgi:hypothetical protein
MPDAYYPCRCLCFWFVQITRTTPARRTILHLSQILLTDALTFIVHLRLVTDLPLPTYNFSTIRPRVRSAGINATFTRSPTSTRM